MWRNDLFGMLGMPDGGIFRGNSLFEAAEALRSKAGQRKKSQANLTQG
jgi:hypothetical protein